MRVLGALESADELAVDTSRRASAVVELVIFPASLHDGIIRSSKKNKEMVILDRIGIRFMMWRIIFAPLLGIGRESGPCLFGVRTTCAGDGSVDRNLYPLTTGRPPPPQETPLGEFWRRGERRGVRSGLSSPVARAV
jgi:hypothetical protein